MQQLLLIPEGKKPLKSIEYSEIEYERLNLLNEFRKDGTRMVIYKNHAWCKWYWKEEHEYLIFEKEEQRDKYMEDLNNYYWTDKHWNNSIWYTKLWIYIDEKQIKDYFWDIFLYCIIFLQKPCENTWQK